MEYNQKEPEEKAKNESTPWYKKWWGALLVLIFFYILGPYLIWTKTNWNKATKFITSAVLVLLFFGLWFSGPEYNPNKLSSNMPSTDKEVTERLNDSEPVEEIAAVFDLNAFYGENIDDIRTALGEPIDGEWTEPNDAQIELGTKEWDNTFEKNGHNLLVTYDVISRSVINFFIATDDPSGKTQDTERLIKLLGSPSRDQYLIEPVAAIKYPSFYTGIKVIPKK